MHKDSLHELPPDIRDIDFGKIHTIPELDNIPDEFIVAKPLKIKHQGGTDFCTAFAGTAVSEDQEAVELDPLWQFAQIKRIMGDMGWGADLRSAAKSFKEYGSIEQKDAPYAVDQARNIIADWKRYNTNLEGKAYKHKKESYQFITPSKYDLFDTIRATLWYNRDKKQTIVTGVKWCAEWTQAQDGFIDKTGTPTEGHAIKIFGATIKRGQQCLIVQNSYGHNSGDDGLYYFTREVINSGFKYGALTFTDMPAEDARYYQDNNIKADDNWLKNFWQMVRGIFAKNMGSTKEEILRQYKFLLQKVVVLITKTLELQQKGVSQVVYEYAKECIGKDMTETQSEYGCVEAINNVIEQATGLEVGGGYSTYLMYHAMKGRPTRFRQVYIPAKGDIIISPTGYGNRIIPNGHVGIVIDNEHIASNNSATDRWDDHLTLSFWKTYFGQRGGYPIYFFRVL